MAIPFAPRPSRGYRGNSRSYSYPGSEPAIHSNSPAVEQQRQEAIAAAAAAGRAVGPRTSLVDAQAAARGTHASLPSSDFTQLAANSDAAAAGGRSVPPAWATVFPNGARTAGAGASPDVNSAAIQGLLNQVNGEGSGTITPTMQSVAKGSVTANVPTGGNSLTSPYGPGGHSTFVDPNAWQQEVMKTYPEIGVKDSEGNVAFRQAYQDANNQQGPGLPPVNPHAIAAKVMGDLSGKRAAAAAQTQSIDDATRNFFDTGPKLTGNPGFNGDDGLDLGGGVSMAKPTPSTRTDIGGGLTVGGPSRDFNLGGGVTMNDASGEPGSAPPLSVGNLSMSTPSAPRLAAGSALAPLTSTTSARDSGTPGTQSSASGVAPMSFGVPDQSGAGTAGASGSMSSPPPASGYSPNPGFGGGQNDAGPGGAPPRSAFAFDNTPASSNPRQFDFNAPSASSADGTAGNTAAASGGGGAEGDDEA